MVQYVDIVNRALQLIGTRTTVTAAELAANGSNEAIQANLILQKFRRRLLRMAPWNCATKPVNLVYVTSLPGIGRNLTLAPQHWQPGLPQPPWAVEYQYPVDCLRALYIAPIHGAWGSEVPATTGVQGWSSSGQRGPVRFETATDNFFSVSGATVANGGQGYANGDLIQLAYGPMDVAPIGAPALLQVVTQIGGVIQSVKVISQVDDDSVTRGGSYFIQVPNPQAQGLTFAATGGPGNGSGATFNLLWNAASSYNSTGAGVDPQRVILSSHICETMIMIQDVGNPNVFDDLFQDAYENILAAGLCWALTGDKSLANSKVQLTNNAIIQAREVDGNEALTINDVPPDWLRIRGNPFFDQFFSSGDGAYEWGSTWNLY
jgi:hypothetical protein